MDALTDSRLAFHLTVPALLRLADQATADAGDAAPQVKAFLLLGAAQIALADMLAATAAHRGGTIVAADLERLAQDFRSGMAHLIGERVRHDA